MSIKAGCNIVGVEDSPNDVFYKSEVYLFSNNLVNGSIGFMTNKHSKYKLSDPVPEFLHNDRPIFYGGPVQDEHLFIVHGYSNLLSYDKCENEVCISSNLDELVFYLKLGKVHFDRIKLFMGYCGWDAGELEGEWLQNCWKIVRSGTGHLFQNSIEKINAELNF